MSSTARVTRFPAAHRLRDLKTTAEGAEIEAIAPIEQTARTLQEVELSVPFLQFREEGKL